MWLTATIMGLAAFWSTPKYIYLLNELLGLESGQRSLGFFFIGKTTIDYPSLGRGDINEKIRWIR